MVYLLWDVVAHAALTATSENLHTLFPAVLSYEFKFATDTSFWVCASPHASTALPNGLSDPEACIRVKPNLILLGLAFSSLHVSPVLLISCWSTSENTSRRIKGDEVKVRLLSNERGRALHAGSSWGTNVCRRRGNACKNAAFPFHGCCLIRWPAGRLGGCRFVHAALAQRHLQCPSVSQPPPSRDIKW